MPRRSIELPGGTFTVDLDLKSIRHGLCRRRQDQGCSGVTANRVTVELERLASYLKGRGGDELDAQANLQLLTELRQMYETLFSCDCPEHDIQQSVVNQELLVLKKLVGDAPLSVIEEILTRLEDLYVSPASEGFVNEKGYPNEKLEAVPKGAVLQPR